MQHIRGYYLQKHSSVWVLLLREEDWYFSELRDVRSYKKKKKNAFGGIGYITGMQYISAKCIRVKVYYLLALSSFFCQGMG